MNKIIITTINKETEAITKFKSSYDLNLILVGDKKTHDYNNIKR